MLEQCLGDDVPRVDVDSLVATSSRLESSRHFGEHALHHPGIVRTCLFWHSVKAEWIGEPLGRWADGTDALRKNSGTRN